MAYVVTADAEGVIMRLTRHEAGKVAEMLGYAVAAELSIPFDSEAHMHETQLRVAPLQELASDFGFAERQSLEHTPGGALAPKNAPAEAEASVSSPA